MMSCNITKCVIIQNSADLLTMTRLSSDEGLTVSSYTTHLRFPYRLMLHVFVLLCERNITLGS